MLVGEYCTREVVVAEGSTEVMEVAHLMRTEHVGTVIIVDGKGGVNKPVGIITDRDLVVEVMASDADPQTLTAADLCAADLLVAKQDDDLMTTLDRMRASGVRRIPVVDEGNALQGLLAVDDLLSVVGEIMGNLTQLVAREVSMEVRKRP